VDRVDYTKGIPERFQAIDYFLEKYPHYQGRFVFVQVGVPSRVHIERYKWLQKEIQGLVKKINWKYETGTWKPIIYIGEHQPVKTLRALYRIGHFCLVSSLHDGMNMVAKEYVASQVDETGVLILSQFTGASRELEEALLVNPYSIEDVGEAIRKAIEMPKRTRQRRMRRLKATVQEHSIYHWAEQVLMELTRFEFV